MGERVPGFLVPVEVAQTRQARERAMIEDDPRVQISPAAAPLERHALTEGVDVAAQGMWQGLGTHVDRHDSIAKLRGHVAGDTGDQ